MSNSFFFQAEDGIRDIGVTGVQTCALPSVDGDEELSPHPRPAGGVAGVHLQRANSIHSYRQRDLQSGSGRLPDADQKPAATARPAVFHATAEVTSGRPPMRWNHLCSVIPALVAGIHVFLLSFRLGRRGWPG